MKLRDATLGGLIALCLAVPIIGAIFFRVYGSALSERVNSTIGLFVGYGPTAWGALALTQALIAVSGILPASVLGIAAGAVYGIPLGFFLTALGTMAGAAIAFGMSRTAFRPFIVRRLAGRPYLERLDRAVTVRGWRTVCLLRFSPVMPFAVGSYALGLTSVTFWRYWLGSLAALPALLGYVVLGGIARHGFGGATSMRPLRLGLMALGLASTCWFILHIGKIAKEVFSLEDPEHIVDGDDGE
jgi:uncharacterized membrane protein YdjX (TVP38/TMEM64 family)